MFKKIWQAIVHFFCTIACDYYWPIWSNIRWHKARRDNVGIDDSEKVSDLIGVLHTAQNIRNVFTWTQDGFNQLYDSMVPPSQLYLDYKNNKILDDCDGFHTTLYHFLYNSQIPAYLLVVAARGGSHCTLLFKMEDQWHICDYACVYEGYPTAAEAIRAYNKSFVTIYNAKSKVYHNSLLYYDYTKKKFRSVRRSKVHKKIILGK